MTDKKELHKTHLLINKLTRQFIKDHPQESEGVPVKDIKSIITNRLLQLALNSVKS